MTPHGDAQKLTRQRVENCVAVPPQCESVAGTSAQAKAITSLISRKLVIHISPMTGVKTEAAKGSIMHLRNLMSKPPK
jgi:hypothetical protein